MSEQIYRHLLLKTKITGHYGFLEKKEVQQHKKNGKKCYHCRDKLII